jgi:hypothetical protein
MAEPKVTIPAKLLKQHVELHADNEATEYSIETNIDDKMLRLGFYNEHGELAKYTMASPEVYEFAHRLLRGYDRLEGID